MAIATKTKKKQPMTQNVGSNPPTYRYDVPSDAHLAYQTALTKTGKMNVLNRKPPSTGKKYFTKADGTRDYT